MKKKILLAMMAATLSFGLLACGNEVSDTPVDEPIIGAEDTVDENEIVVDDVETDVEDVETEGVETENTEVTPDETMTEDVENIDDPEALENLTANMLNEVWATYADDEKPAVMGGDANNMVDGAPGGYNIEDVAGIESFFHITSDNLAFADEVASVVHAMNANTFTAGAFHIADVKNVDAFIASAKESILSTQWMCGFPEKLVIITVNDDYVISAFGNGEIIDNFSAKVVNVYGDAAVVAVDTVIE